MTDTQTYDNPLIKRYASARMGFLFSPQFKFQTWRQLWILLAEAERELGLPITEEQIADLRAHETDINFAEAEKREKAVRHDVMAHVHAYGLQAKKAAGIIHLGATSAYVTDNTDLIQMRDGPGPGPAPHPAGGRGPVRASPANTRTCPPWASPISSRPSSPPWASAPPCGSRTCSSISRRSASSPSGLPFLGVKGTTGTQASFLELFDGDHGKVKALDEKVTQEGRLRPQPGRLRPDLHPQARLPRAQRPVLPVPEPVQVRHRPAPAAKPQGGRGALREATRSAPRPWPTSAIPCAPSASAPWPASCRPVTNSLAFTASTQWFERTLDDSANRRLAVPQAFLAADAMLILAENIADGLVVYPKIIARHVLAELPFMATENILMAGVKQGGDRQELHEAIRQHSLEAAKRVKQDGLDNDLLDAHRQGSGLRPGRQGARAT